MQSSVTKSGQIAIPASLRKKFGLKTGDHLKWVEDGGTLRLVPVRNDAIRELRGKWTGRGVDEIIACIR